MIIAGNGNDQNFQGGGGIFEKFSARGYTKNTPLPPIPVAWIIVNFPPANNCIDF